MQAIRPGLSYTTLPDLAINPANKPEILRLAPISATDIMQAE